MGAYMNVTPDMVRYFNVSEMCMESLPCQHNCKITLTDGREKTVRLRRPEIESILTSIAKEAIANTPPSCVNGKSSRKSDQILTEIFM